MKYKLAYILMILLWAGSVSAQTFGYEGMQKPQRAAAEFKAPAGNRNRAVKIETASTDETLNQINQAFATSRTDNDVSVETQTDDPLAQISQALVSGGKKAAGEAAAQAAAETAEEEDIFIPEGELYRLNTPTADGSKRGGAAFVELDEKGRMKKVEKIFLFYDEFKITSYSSSRGSCDVRFNILSNLDRKITQLDIKLVWPDLTTTLSFSDVEPNTQNYYHYSLLGNGCYNMDKAPNIIVNRCRVKGLTAAQCADKLVWLSK